MDQIWLRQEHSALDGSPAKPESGQRGNRMGGPGLAGLRQESAFLLSEVGAVGGFRGVESGDLLYLL